VALRLLNRTMSAEHTTALAAFFGRTPGSRLRASDPAAGWQFPHLVALLLNSPSFALR
jgi:hypothetical protein